MWEVSHFCELYGYHGSGCRPGCDVINLRSSEVVHFWQAAPCIVLRVALMFVISIHECAGIATRYRMDGRGIKSWWGRDFPQLSRPALGPTQPPVQWIPGLLPGGKAAATWRIPLTPSSAEVKERVKACVCSPCGPSQPVIG
jgi:hypothetical protein